MKSKLQQIDGQMRVRMIAIIWKQWKTRAKRVLGLCKLGIGMKQAIPKEKPTKRGLIGLSDYYDKVHI